MRVLFPLRGFVDWNGGLDFVRLILAALSHPSLNHRVDVRIAMPKTSRSHRAYSAALRRWRARYLRSKLPGRNAEARTNSHQIAEEIVAGYHVVECGHSGTDVLKAAVADRADVIFPTMFPLGPLPPVHRIGYLFDFQHRHFPHLFSARTQRNRDRRFSMIADDADGILVNSRAVAREVAQFLGVSTDRILAMPFTPYAQPWRFETDPADVKLRYGIRSSYLLISNHFWIHKDHATALRAFALIKHGAHHRDLELVLTGDPVDHRDPSHYERLRKLSESLGIAEDTHFLGLVPKRDQLALLRGCRALVQPTLFEGGPGGGSVYDAIGLGVPAVVSDIEVNREIDQGNIQFFRASDETDLAEKLIWILEEDAPRTDQDVLLARGDANLERLGNAISDFLDRLVNLR